MTITEPTFDKNGYPTDETLETIRTWPYTDPQGWLKFCAEAWDDERGFSPFATGGWSGNEDIISAMRGNHLLWMTCWYSSTRGGQHVFKLPGTPETVVVEVKMPGEDEMDRSAHDAGAHYDREALRWFIIGWLKHEAAVLKLNEKERGK